MAENFLAGLDLNLIGSEKKAFQYELDDAFWSRLNQEEILGGDVKVCIEARKMAGDIFSLSIKASGMVKTICDRCLEQISIPIETAENINATYGDAADGLRDDILLTERRSSKLDISWLLYEIIVTSLPTIRKHEEGQCNADMAERISMA